MAHDLIRRASSSVAPPPAAPPARNGEARGAPDGVISARAPRSRRAPDALGAALARAVADRTVAHSSTNTSLLQRGFDYQPAAVEPFLIKRGDKISEKTGLPIWLPNSPMKTTVERDDVLVAPRNPKTAFGKWVYHSTTLGNLAGVKRIGFDPALGGKQKGGACYLAPEGELKNTSIDRSANKVSGAVDRNTIATYLGMKEDFVESDKDEALDAQMVPVLLRFRTKEEWKDHWIRDPDDARAWQLQGVTVPAADIECLLHEGWVGLDRLELDSLPETERAVTD